jgi:hypothetical protein
VSTGRGQIAKSPLLPVQVLRRAAPFFSRGTLAFADMGMIINPNHPVHQEHLWLSHK